MRVGARTEQQIMLTHVFQVHLYDIWRMIGMVHLDTIQGDFSAYFIKQGNIVEGKAFLLTPRMCNQANRTTAVGSIDSLGHIRHNRMETGLANQT